MFAKQIRVESSESSSRRVSDQRGGVGADPDEERLDVKLHKSTHMVTIDVYYTIRPFKTSSRRVLEIGFGRVSDQRGGVGAEPDEERLDFRAAQRPPLHPERVVRDNRLRALGAREREREREIER